MLGRDVILIYEQITSEVRGRVGIMTMNRPEKLNAMTGQMVEEMRHLLEAWNANDTIGAVVWTGAGRGFCSGADIAGFEAELEGQTRDRQPGIAQDNWHETITTSKPVIAAINGVAVGGGLTFTLPCDIRLASETARLSFRFVRIGVTPEFASTHYAVYLIGLARTLEMMLTGKMIEADEAYRIGLVNHIYPPDELLDKAIELAAEIADNPTWQLSQTKRLIHRDYLEHDINGVLADEMSTFRIAQKTHAHREAMLAFRAKRSPRFH